MQVLALFVAGRTEIYSHRRQQKIVSKWKGTAHRYRKVLSRIREQERARKPTRKAALQTLRSIVSPEFYTSWGVKCWSKVTRRRQGSGHRNWRSLLWACIFMVPRRIDSCPKSWLCRLQGIFESDCPTCLWHPELFLQWLLSSRALLKIGH